jgi:hypothetical protein
MSDVSYDVLAALQAKGGKKKKKGQKGTDDVSPAPPSHVSDASGASSTPSNPVGGKKRKGKKIVMTSDEIAAIPDAPPSRSARAAPSARSGGETVRAPLKEYNNAIIIASPSGMTLQEQDLPKIFNDVPLGTIHAETGYFIIEFLTDTDRKKALKRNRTRWRGSVSILVGEYEAADEYPPVIADRGGYGHDRSPGGGGGGGFVFGSRQQPAAEPMQRRIQPDPPQVTPYRRPGQDNRDGPMQTGIPAYRAPGAIERRQQPPPPPAYKH